MHKPFKTFNTRTGTFVRVHNTDVTNRAAECYGRIGYEAARAAIAGDGEYTSGGRANRALDLARAAFEAA